VTGRAERKHGEAPNIALENEFLQAEVLPHQGAGLARLEARRGNERLNVLRPMASDADTSDPDELACYPLVPWSNRIAQGRFTAPDGRAIVIEPNRVGERFPLHGYGWQRPWEVSARHEHNVTLVLDHTGLGTPFDFVSMIRYELEGATFSVTLSVTNRGLPMYFGLGLHPWLPRSPKLRLRAPAREMWATDINNLPVTRARPAPEFDFSQEMELPNEGVDNAFTGWDGHAQIVWPEMGLTLQLHSDVRCYQLYAPAGKDFFCLEPVDHPANAHNLPGAPTEHGLSALATGASLIRQFSFDVSVGNGSE
jgi:aldose 1-epimerase